MTFKPATAETVVDVLRKFADFVEKEEMESRDLIAGDVNQLLDTLKDLDYFGTEGQCDPRGDHRE